MRQTPNAYGLSAFYDLKDMEERVMVEWLIGDRKEDVRYTLYRLLRSPEVQARFGLILIDCPPRLTTACIQALCASTHLLIPTVLDATSAKAVGYFGTQLKRHEKLWPHLKVAGVLGTMTRHLNGEREALQTAGDQLRATLTEDKSKLNWLHRAGIPFGSSASVGQQHEWKIGPRRLLFQTFRKRLQVRALYCLFGNDRHPRTLLDLETKCDQVLVNLGWKSRRVQQLHRNATVTPIRC